MTNASYAVFLWSGIVLSYTAAARFTISIAAQKWYTQRADEVIHHEPFDCNYFCVLMNQPQPWYVKVNDALEAKGL